MKFIQIDQWDKQELIQVNFIQSLYASKDENVTLIKVSRQLKGFMVVKLELLFFQLYRDIAIKETIRSFATWKVQRIIPLIIY